MVILFFTFFTKNKWPNNGNSPLCSELPPVIHQTREHVQDGLVEEIERDIPHGQLVDDLSHRVAGGVDLYAGTGAGVQVAVDDGQSLLVHRDEVLGVVGCVGRGLLDVGHQSLVPVGSGKMTIQYKLLACRPL